MPELPEVETVRRGLEPAMTGHVISKAEVFRPDLRWPFPENMANRLTGATVLQLRRRSKYILCDLSTQETLLIHLGMSGRMTIQAPSGNTELGIFARPIAPREKHDHVVFTMDSGAVIAFNDPRRFGAMDLLPLESADHHKLLRNIGPEPLGNQFDADYLFERLQTKSSPIKTVLLDQNVVAGLGNIYVCEVLWRAGISPIRKANKIARKRSDTLVPAIRRVLEQAIEAGGSSLRDHRQVDGELGYFQHSFNVYGREGDPCRNETCVATIKRIVQSGRSSFYCPTCQR